MPTSAITPVPAVRQELRACPARRVRLDDGERDRADGDDEQRHAHAVDASTRAAGASDSRSRDAPRHNDIAPIGRLMKKAHGQPTVCTMNEPRLGPTAAAKPPTAPHRLTVTARRLCGNAASTIDSDAGVSRAAPTACSTRAAISQPTLPARPHAPTQR